MNFAALTVTPAAVTDANWYPDSGATNHIIAEPSNLMQRAEYSGTDQVHVGNGMGLNIKHIGQTEFITPYSSKRLKLSHLLHVPEITKNLLSVSKFCLDNGVLFEFHADSCFVKDKASKTVLLEGKLANGLYSFDKAHLRFIGGLQQPCMTSTNSVPCFSVQSNLVSCNTFDLWHKRLEHPSSKVVKSVLSICNVSYNKESKLLYLSSMLLWKNS